LQCPLVPPTVEDVADLLNINRSTLYRAFSA
jgi:predicted transcriptional regulator